MGEIFYTPDDGEFEGGGSGGGQGDPQAQNAPDGNVVSYIQGTNRTNTTTLGNLFTATPASTATALAMTSLFVDIACTGTGSILTILANGAQVLQWTAVGGAISLNLPGPLLMTGGPGEAIAVRVNNDATRTRSNVTAVFSVYVP